jgi:hypothetical protein
MRSQRDLAAANLAATELHELAREFLLRPDAPDLQRKFQSLTSTDRFGIVYEMTLVDRELKGLPPPRSRRDVVRFIRPGQPTILCRRGRTRLVHHKRQEQPQVRPESEAP